MRSAAMMQAPFRFTGSYEAAVGQGRASLPRAAGHHRDARGPSSPPRRPTAADASARQTARPPPRTVQYSLSARQMACLECIQRRRSTVHSGAESMLTLHQKRPRPAVVREDVAPRRDARDGLHLLARIAGTAVAVPVVTTFLAVGAALLMGHSLVHVARHARGTTTVARRVASRRNEGHR